DAVAGVDLGLSIERDNDRSTLRSPRVLSRWHPPPPAGSAALASAPAPWSRIAARHGGPYVSHHLEAAGGILEHLGDVRAHLAQSAVATWRGTRLRLVHDRCARQFFRKLAARLLAFFWRFIGRCQCSWGCGLCLGFGFGLGSLELFKPQFELHDLTLD